MGDAFPAIKPSGVPDKVALEREPVGLDALQLDEGTGAHSLEHGGIAAHPAEHVDRAGRADFGTVAGRGRTEEDAEGGAGRASVHKLPAHRL